MTDLARISFVDSYDPNNFNVDTSIYSLFSLEQIMVRNPTCISPNTLIKDAAELFLKSEFHALPVVEDEKLIGIITTTDLIQYLLEQYWVCLFYCILARLIPQIKSPKPLYLH